MPLNAVLDRPEAVAPVPQLGGTQPYRVFVADDQTDVIEAVRLLLTGNDFVVAPAT